MNGLKIKKWAHAWACLAVLSFPASAAEGVRYDSVEAFIRTVRGTNPEQSLENYGASEAYGDLTGAGRKDWVGSIFANDPDGISRQIVVLVQDPDGKYRLAAADERQSANGGTGSHGVDGLRISNGSIFISWDWHWHNCAGGVEHQIKFYKGQWRVIGATFHQLAARTDKNGEYADDSAEMSHNLLTGDVIIHFQPWNRRLVTRKLHITPQVVLLNAQYGESAGAVAEFSKYAGC